ncbi:hypothetical protein QTP88_009323 [Uroleucon formosanum]
MNYKLSLRNILQFVRLLYSLFIVRYYSTTNDFIYTRIELPFFLREDFLKGKLGVGNRIKNRYNKRHLPLSFLIVRSAYEIMSGGGNSVLCSSGGQDMASRIQEFLEEIGNPMLLKWCKIQSRHGVTVTSRCRVTLLCQGLDPISFRHERRRKSTGYLNHNHASELDPKMSGNNRIARYRIRRECSTQ